MHLIGLNIIITNKFIFNKFKYISVQLFENIDIIELVKFQRGDTGIAGTIANNQK